MSRLVVVYGAQWGSEGKGQICAAIAQQDIPPNQTLYAVRVGGPNAGHTITDARGRVLKLQQIPVAAFVRPDVVPVIGCSGLILPEVLERELGWLRETWGGDAPRLTIDRGAVVILPEHMEREAGLKRRISSTGEGVGAATADKVMRRAMTFEQWCARDACRMAEVRQQFTFADTVRLLNGVALQRDAVVMLEGTQGHLLSLNTSGYYPYCTSRECGPDAICSQVGISPRAFSWVDIVAVMRTFPIRVGGPSGPLPHEITWEDLKERTGGYVDTPERTTVTNRERRIAELDLEMLKQTLRETRPTALAVSFLDYLFPQLARKTELDGEATAWLEGLQSETNTWADWISTGAGQRFTFRHHSPF